MIGILLVTENLVSIEQAKSIERLLGQQAHFIPLTLSFTMSSQEMKNLLDVSLEQVATKEVLIFTELWGSTQARACLSVLEKDKIEALFGYNYPMLLKSFTLRKQGMSLHDLLKQLKLYGAEHIWYASHQQDMPQN